MLRRISALACLLGLLGAPMLAASRAGAATGDVLTAHWWSGDRAGGHVRSATVTAGTSGGATFRNAYATYISVLPPSGARFEAGRAYQAAATRTTALAGIAQHGYSTCHWTQWTGTIDVAAAEYDEAGTLTSFAASYTARCPTSGGRTDVVAGDLRLADASPYPAVLPSYVSAAVALGHERQTTATLVGAGAIPVTLGGASVVGTHRADYRVTTNGCDGVTLTDTRSCQVGVAFAPQGTVTGARPARLVVQAPGRLDGSVSVPLDAEAVWVPGAPRTLTSFPVADGVGVTWLAGTPGAEKYHLERRWSADEPWTPVTVVPSPGSRLVHVDADVAPGQAVEYRVRGENAGWLGEAETTATVRAVDVPAPSAVSGLAVGSARAAGPAVVFRTTDPDTTVTAWGSDHPQVQGSRDGTYAAHQTFYAPPVPGPGVYRMSTGQGGGISGALTELNCRYVDSVLRVREVLFDRALKPLVYDASWTGWCEDQTVARAEIRYGVDADLALTMAAPMAAGPLTTHGGTPVTQTVTLGNRGPLPVRVGPATVAGDAAADWAVAANACTGTSLAAGETCSLTVRFATATGGARNARLEVAMAEATAELAPHVVPLRGRGAVVPDAPLGLYPHDMLAGVQVYWRAPYETGGYPVDRYEVQRRPADGTSRWAQSGTTTALNVYDAAVAEGEYFDYRVRAVNAVGPGPWITVQGASLATAGVVVEGETAGAGGRALYLVSAVNGWPPAVPMTAQPTHRHSDPVVSAGGTRLVYSRSTSAGPGDDGEIDLWRTSVPAMFGATPVAPTRLTDLAGSELDAAFSPDASRVAFTHVGSDGASSVWLVPTTGGAPVLLVGQAADPTWTPSGDAVVVEDPAGGPLRVVPVDGGGPVTWDGTQGGTDPAISRGGSLAFVDGDGNLAEIGPGELVPTVRRVIPDWQPISHPAYTATGSLLVTQRNSVGSGLLDVTADDGRSGGLRQVGPAAPAIRDVHAPSVHIDRISDSYVRGTQEVAFDYQDGVHAEETPRTALRVDCRLDGAVWGTCRSPVTLSGLSDGAHTLRVRVRDEAGRQTVTSASFVSDTSAPSVALTGPRGIANLDDHATFTWRGTDPHSTVPSYDIAWRRAGRTGGFSPWRSRAHVTDNRFALRLDRGQEVCLRVRARNRTGYLSAWRTRCVGRPVDDAGLGADRRWRFVLSPRSMDETLAEATAAGAQLSSSTVTGRRIALLAQTCPGCGSVRVYAGSRLVGRLLTSSPMTRSRVLLPLPLLPREFTGRVRVVTTSRSPVRVDGLLVRRT